MHAEYKHCCPALFQAPLGRRLLLMVVHMLGHRLQTHKRLVCHLQFRPSWVASSHQQLAVRPLKEATMSRSCLPFS